MVKDKLILKKRSDHKYPGYDTEVQGRDRKRTYIGVEVGDKGLCLLRREK